MVRCRRYDIDIGGPEGGLPQECVYDQTKLVVIEEELRELILNERFSRYATAVGFRIRAYEGYDPESNTRPASTRSRCRKPRRRLEAEQSPGSFLEGKFSGSPVNRLALEKLRNRQSPG